MKRPTPPSPPYEGGRNDHATLAELADLLAQAGAVDAINLDGGRSTQLFFQGGLTTPSGGRYGMPGVYFERMAPAIGVLW